MAKPWTGKRGVEMMAVSRWNDKRVRVGWTIRNKAGLLCRVMWVENGCVTYKVIEPQPVIETQTEKQTETANT